EQGDEPGALIATVTETFHIPYRPSADSGNCPGKGEESEAAGSRWYDAVESKCYKALATAVTFKKLPIVLPDDAVITVAYNTSTQGYHPWGTGTACYS